MEEQNISQLTFICEECESLNHLQNVTIKKHNLFNCQHCDEESYFTGGLEYVYVLDSNYSDLLKLGYTARNTSERLAEINIATGAIPWDMAIHYETLSGHKLEQLLYSMFEEFRVLKKEQLDIRLKEFVVRVFEETKMKPDYIRPDLQFIIDLFSQTPRKVQKPKQTSNKKPILKCPKCGFENPFPFAHIRTYCKNCGKVIPRK